MKIAVRARDPHVNCLLLNNLDGVHRQRFLDDWLRSRVRICADGALDLLKALARELAIDMAALLPDYLVGDLDSAGGGSVEEYQKAGGQVVECASQCSTDFDKCVGVYAEKASPTDGEWLLVFGAMGGDRLDHTLAAFHPLLCHPGLRLKLVQGPAQAFLVPPGEHELVIEDDALQGSKCGLFPVGRPSKVTTEGLRWNVSDDVLCYGDLVSVSNEPVAPSVHIKTDHPLIFTIQTR